MYKIKWELHVEGIKKYLTDDKYTIIPKYVKRFGKENFLLKNDKLFLNGKEIITDFKRKQTLISAEEELYGGQTKAYDRLRQKYINISRSDVEQIFRGSERRQLKARYQPQKNSYLYAGRPGHIEIDLTFYRNQKFPVFGAIDVYSRYVYYKRLPNKRTASVVEELKTFLKTFHAVSKFKVHKISTDSGSEFADFQKYIDSLRAEAEENDNKNDNKKKKKKTVIFYDRQVKSRKLIENLNNSLRQYVERVGWDTVSDLDKLIENFVKSYNASKHSTTKRTPNDMVAEESPIGVRKVKRVSGFTKAELRPGDTVRVYDPRRTEIKTQQKKKLKGKIKLSEKDYVKQFTSYHRGQEPHWTKETFKVKRVIHGRKRETRYTLHKKEGTFFRHELQKVVKVTKRDPRIKVMDRREKAKQRLKDEVPMIRAAKFVGKEIVLHYNDEEKPLVDDPATVLLVYKNHFIVFHNSLSMKYATLLEYKKMTGKKYPKRDVNTWININPEQIQTIKNEIDEHIQEILDS